jgi:glutamine---fructose-6-phosphate transaminase (isomerizing)
MCGIIGYTGRRNGLALILDGLAELEYRGYDSAGVVLHERGALSSVRAVGPLQNLRRALASRRSDATVGLGHTRWATHGAVSEANAHPLVGCSESEVAIVLNGIVENHRELRDALRARGHVVRSETDAEVVVHLIEERYDGDLAAAVRATAAELQGHFAFVVLHRDHPETLVAVRRQCPLVVGVGDGECFVGSNTAAFRGEASFVQFPNDDETVVVTSSYVAITAADGTPVAHELEPLAWDGASNGKADHDTWMLKEMYEQPEAVRATLEPFVRDGLPAFDDAGLSDELLRRFDRVVLLSAGTSYHAAVVARYAIESWSQLPVEADISSEWLYRDAVVGERTLVVAVSQSGETRDTISALQLARRKGAFTVAITNTRNSQIAREADAVLLTRAGVETSVAASKTFTAQVALFYLLALQLAWARQTLPEMRVFSLTQEVAALPDRIRAFLEVDHPIEEIAGRVYDERFFFYLGRHIGLPVALEGALKLKEIAYIPTEAYSAGEMKHGPIALIDEGTPVVVVATNSHVYDKILSNIAETRARGARVIAIATDGNEEIQHYADDVIFVPRTSPLLQPVLAVIPLQLLAYRIAALHGHDVDRPRNLAKTVTVE